jgi:hypothetical protein
MFFSDLMFVERGGGHVGIPVVVLTDQSDMNTI